MDRESIAKLKIDRRLIGRRGWISKEDLESEIEQIPDSAHKIMPANEGGEEDAPAASAPSTDTPG